jgi:hypothetical protein
VWCVVGGEPLHTSLMVGSTGDILGYRMHNRLWDVTRRRHMLGGAERGSVDPWGQPTPGSTSPPATMPITFQ